MTDQNQRPQPYTECPECCAPLIITGRHLTFDLQGELQTSQADSFEVWCEDGCCMPDPEREVATIERAFAPKEEQAHGQSHAALIGAAEGLLADLDDDCIGLARPLRVEVDERDGEYVHGRVAAWISVYGMPVEEPTQ